MSDDVKTLWAQRAAEARRHAAACELRCDRVDLGAPDVLLAELTLPALDGSEVHARTLVPRGGSDHPVLLMFHDANRGVRGWHHMLRFVALGYAVLALESRDGVRGVLVQEPLAVGDGLGVAMRVGDALPPLVGRTIDAQTQAVLEATYLDALVLAAAAGRLEGVDASSIVTWGEGLGGGIALVVASLMGARGAIALNPLPAALDGSCSSVDVASISSGMACPVLMGTCLLDLQATPAAQDVVAEGLSHVRRLRYPRYLHERVNAFEDEMVPFLISLHGDAC